MKRETDLASGSAGQVPAVPAAVAAGARTEVHSMDAQTPAHGTRIPAAAVGLIVVVAVAVAAAAVVAVAGRRSWAPGG